MARTCLLVDLDEAGLAEVWQEAAARHQYPLELKYVSTQEAEALFDSGHVVAAVFFAKAAEKRRGLLELLEAFRTKIGLIPQFQAIVCPEPEPNFLNDIFEFGIETFFRDETWPDELLRLTRLVSDTLADKSASEERVMQLTCAISKGDKDGMAEAEKSLADAAQYDYVAAYAKGQALQAFGKFDEAAEAFRTASKLNKYFRPAHTGLGENLLVLGKVDEAIAIFEKLEKINSRDIDRKAFLAVAYVEKGDMAKANKCIAEAVSLNPDHPRITEAKAQMLLVTGKVGEAFKLMSDLKDVGPFFAVKLNELGIHLSQLGKGQNALALYEKAHKIVKKELKYKISLNAALACYRMEEFENALKYLGRCEQEYGSKLEKSEKIRQACEEGIKTRGADVKAAG